MGVTASDRKLLASVKGLFGVTLGRAGTEHTQRDRVETRLRDYVAREDVANEASAVGVRASRVRIVDRDDCALRVAGVAEVAPPLCLR